MAVFHASKVVSSLPGVLAANTIYFVRVGTGFRQYVTNSSGTIVAYALDPIAWSEITGKPTLLEASNNLSDLGNVATARGNLGLGTAATVSAKAFRGSIHGLTLSNNVTDATNDINIAAGMAWENVDDVPLVLTAAMTKRLDAGHAAGTNAGGLDTGTKANSTWYHVHLVGRSDTSAIDATLSTNASTPSLASAWDWNRRIGSIYVQSGGAILPFTQRGDRFSATSAFTILSGATPSATNLTLLCPLGVVTRPIFSMSNFVTVGDGRIRTYTATEIGSAVSVSIVGLGGYSLGGATVSQLHSNTSSQVAVAANDNTTHQVTVTSLGWIDTRGRDS